MKVLGVGINPSNRDRKAFHFNSNSEPDISLRKSFSYCFGEGNYQFTDLIKKRMSNKKFKQLTRDELLDLCNQYRKRFVEEVKEFKPEIIILLTISHKVIINFIEDLRERYNLPKTFLIWHPSYAIMRKRVGWKGYAQHIKDRVI